MFTGLIQDIGTLSSLRRVGNDVSFEFLTGLSVHDFELGESIAVNGVCLTVTSFSEGRFSADASSETLRRSALGGLRKGQRVHLERAMQVGDRLGGHIVQGHVDGCAEVIRVDADGKAWDVYLRMSEALSGELVEKGSITVDGVSLTVNELTPEGCRLTIVGFTSQKTLLVDYKPGQSVNIETDIIGKYVRRWMAPHQQAKGSTTEALLRQYGYMGGGN